MLSAAFRAQVCIIATDRNAKMVYVNPVAYRYLGYLANELVGHPIEVSVFALVLLLPALYAPSLAGRGRFCSRTSSKSSTRSGGKRT